MTTPVRSSISLQNEISNTLIENLSSGFQVIFFSINNHQDDWTKRFEISDLEKGGIQ